MLCKLIFQYNTFPLRSGRGVVLTTHPHLSAKVKKEYGYTSTPPLGLHGLLWEHLYLYFLVKISKSLKWYDCCYRIIILVKDTLSFMEVVQCRKNLFFQNMTLQVFVNWLADTIRNTTLAYLGGLCTWGVQVVRYPNFFLGNGSR